MAEKLLQDVLIFVNNNELEEIVKNNMKLFEFIGTAGYITNLYGTGRPESGSEHIMAKEIEANLDIPHGISVSIGILIMGLMQNRDITKILKAIKKLNVFEKQYNYGINKDIIQKCIRDLKPRNGRYTIVDKIYTDELYKNKCLMDFFDLVKI